MRRGLFSEHYSIFANHRPPNVSPHHPLGVTTFFDEYLCYIDRTHKKIQFGGQQPPAFLKRLLELRMSLSDEDDINTIGTGFLLEATYNSLFPQYPLSGEPPARCVADILIAIALESERRIQHELGKKLFVQLARSPQIISPVSIQDRGCSRSPSFVH